MPVKLSDDGLAAVERDTGKVKRRFKSRKKAKAYVDAVNMSYARKNGKDVPPEDEEEEKGKAPPPRRASESGRLPSVRDQMPPEDGEEEEDEEEPRRRRR